jgi:hypothetical protein
MMLGSNDSQSINWGWSKNSDQDAFVRDYTEFANSLKKLPS